MNESKCRKNIALATLSLILLCNSPAFSLQSNQNPPQSSAPVESQERLEHRRQQFADARRMLLDRRVPFEPEQLLEDDWPKKLKPVLDSMPEMHESRYEHSPLKGVYLADTLYLPEKVQLDDDTVIVVNNLVFEGNEILVKGHHSLHIFPTQPTGVLGTTLAKALYKKSEVFNVALSTRRSLPSFSLIRDLDQPRARVTFDISAPDPQPVPSNRKQPINARTVSWQSLVTNTSGDTGKTGTTGFSPGQAMSGGTPPKAPTGKCGGVAGQSGSAGGDGAPGQPGGIGGPGGPGGNANDQLNVFVADNDLRQYTYIANGGVGGQGGTGGTGARGGNGGNGGAGGDGFACACELGEGGRGGTGGAPGTGGNGGNGGVGGQGGIGGQISVSIPWNHPGVITSNSGGAGGRGGDPGANGLSGNPGAGGIPGIGASACGMKAADGSPGNIGPVGTDGVGGSPGAFGPQGQNGPMAQITRRQPPAGGGGGGTGGGTACGNGAGNTGGPTALGDGGSDDASTTCGPGAGSPIIVDTEGEGFHLTSVQEGVTFDIAGNGHPIKIAWTAVGSHNAFLALDRGEGISSGKDLFGNFTAQDASPHPNGFLALAEFDEPDQGGNGDGIIDEQDAVFSKLKLWIDENHDGVAQSNELHSLPELGIYSLSLRYFESRRVDQYGNAFRYKAQVNAGGRRDRRDNTDSAEIGRWAYDVFFMTAP